MAKSIQRLTDQRVLVTGGTGLIGSSLVYRLLALGYQVSVLSRHPNIVRQLFADQVSCWTTLREQRSLEDIYAVINLAGEPIMGKRWSTKQKEQLCQSRWVLTERLASLINSSRTPPALFISGSAMGYYGDQGEAMVNEKTLPHDEFSHQLCMRWETLARQAESAHTRVCLCRTGIVLSPHGGALAKMLPLFRLGLGGVFGDGTQYVPWIHLQDMISAICHLLITPNLHGPFNMVAPNPVSNRIFTRTLAQVLRRPAVLPVPATALRLLLGEAATLLLGGQRGLPLRLQHAGFTFHFTDLNNALYDLLVTNRHVN